MKPSRRQPRLKRPEAQGFVNAVLRRYDRESAELEAQLPDDPVVRYAHPFWLVDTLQRDWPDNWRGRARRQQSARAADAAHQPPPHHARRVAQAPRRNADRRRGQSLRDRSRDPGQRARRRPDSRLQQRPGFGAGRLSAARRDAATLARRLPRQHYRVMVVETDRDGDGLGDFGTTLTALPSIRPFHDSLGIDENLILRAARAQFLARRRFCRLGRSRCGLVPAVRRDRRTARSGRLPPVADAVAARGPRGQGSGLFDRRDRRSGGPFRPALGRRPINIVALWLWPPSRRLGLSRGDARDCGGARRPRCRCAVPPGATRRLGRDRRA